MAATVKIQIKQLKELQAAMKSGSSSLDPEKVKPILLEAVTIIRDEAYRLLRSVTSRTPNLDPGWEHIEDALVAEPGKSSTIASAFAKVFRKRAPQAIWIEFGHRIVGHRPKRTDTGKAVPPRPFFRPAIMTKRTEARRTVRVGLQKLLAAGFGFGQPGNAGD